MSKVICERDQIVAIADAVRGKMSSPSEMTLEQIANNINDDITSSIQTCTVSIPANGLSGNYHLYYFDSTGNVQTYTFISSEPDEIICQKNSFIISNYANTFSGDLVPTSDDNCQVMGYTNSVLMVTGDVTLEYGDNSPT